MSSITYILWKSRRQVAVTDVKMTSLILSAFSSRRDHAQHWLFVAYSFTLISSPLYSKCLCHHQDGCQRESTFLYFSESENERGQPSVLTSSPAWVTLQITGVTTTSALDTVAIFTPGKITGVNAPTRIIVSHLVFPKST
jgi:hypothetical protein